MIGLRRMASGYHGGWVVPHVVSYKRHWRYYSRNSSGKYPLDIATQNQATLEPCYPRL
jgi:hypothetical protein